MHVMSVERLQALLRGAFPEAEECDIADRTGTGDHFHVLVVDKQFHGMPLLEQHRAVNTALAEALEDGTIHELRISTRGAA